MSTHSVTPFDFEGKSVRTVLNDKGEPLFVATDVCRILEISKKTNAYARLNDDEKEMRQIDTPGGPQQMVVINKSGLKRLIIKSVKPKAIELAHTLGIEVLCAEKEQSTLSIISAAFSHLAQTLQYHVCGYQIDLYFPEYNIAVECDEFGHNTHADTIRQRAIEQKLACRFIRYNPDEQDFNVGVVINNIIRCIES